MSNSHSQVGVRAGSCSSGLRALRVSVIVGTLTKHDAIANACRQRLAVLQEYCHERKLKLQLKVYSHAAEGDRSWVQIVENAQQIIGEPHFLHSDLVLYEFGIRTDLFESIHFAPRPARVVVFHHGVTHPHVAPAPTRPILYASFEQMRNLFAADEVVVTSGFLAREVDRIGLPRSRVSIMRLPAGFTPDQDVVPPKPAPANRGLQLLYVGRFVPAKGVCDLIDAVALARGMTPCHIRLRLIGSLAFSDREYLESLKCSVRELGIEDIVSWHFDVPAAMLRRAYTQADALVIPSYHEGLCVPVIEAYQHKCGVIASAAAALPETMGGLGLCYSPGDVNALADCVSRFAEGWARGEIQTDVGPVDRSTWERRVDEHVEQFHPTRFRASLFELFDRHLPEPVELEVKRRMALAKLQVLQEWHNHSPANLHQQLEQELQPLYERLGVGSLPPPPIQAPSRRRVIWTRFKENVKRVPGLGWTAVRAKRLIASNLPIDGLSYSHVKRAVKATPVVGRVAIGLKRAITERGKRPRGLRHQLFLTGLHTRAGRELANGSRIHERR